MSGHIASDWNNRDETVMVDGSLHLNRIIIVRAGRVSEAIRVDVDDLLEAIYGEYPDRRPASSERPPEAEPEEPAWASARVVSAETPVGDVVHLLRIDSLDAWRVSDSGALYYSDEFSYYFGNIQIVIGADS